LRYGRSDEDWERLFKAGLEFLEERARLERVTSYSEMNFVMHQRTGVRPFDFDQDGERAAMGQLLGRISEEGSLPAKRVLISALVNYLDSNDAGPGFYKFARRMGLMPPGLSASARWEWWAGHVREVFERYAS
jgi:hypothetical protein